MPLAISCARRDYLADDCVVDELQEIFIILNLFCCAHMSICIQGYYMADCFTHNAFYPYPNDQE
jgi:hypothetical protein